MSDVGSGVPEDEQGDRHSFEPAATGRRVAIFAHPPALAAFLVLLALVWLAMLLGHAGPVDRALFGRIYGSAGPQLVHVAWIVTRLGSPEFLYAILAVAAIVALVQPRRARGLILFIVICLTCRLLVTLQKNAFALPRPNAFFGHVATHSYAFPSGHTSNSTVTYLSLALILFAGSRWRPAAVAVGLAIAVVVGVSRIILGVHWPTDVLAGWAFGSFWTVGCLWLVRGRLSARDTGGA